MIGAALQCLRCGHEWNTRTERKPVQCPRCKSPAWDRNRLPVYLSPGERPSFAEIASWGVWKDRPESDEELLIKLGSPWNADAAD